MLSCFNSRTTTTLNSIIRSLYYFSPFFFSYIIYLIDYLFFYRATNIYPTTYFVAILLKNIFYWIIEVPKWTARLF